MEPSAGPPERTPPVSEARCAVFTVVVERSGGIAGLLRRWTAEIIDDGGAAARAAHRIAGLTGDCRSEAAQKDTGPAGDRATSDRQVKERRAVRDGFQWSVRCGEGSMRCDEADRHQDPEVDELIRTVTSAEGGPADAS